ncbi:hypothetical protein JCM11491_007032 [Sporobolomyces phaffii]
MPVRIFESEPSAGSADEGRERARRIASIRARLWDTRQRVMDVWNALIWEGYSNEELRVAWRLSRDAAERDDDRVRMGRFEQMPPATVIQGSNSYSSGGYSPRPQAPSPPRRTPLYDLGPGTPVSGRNPHVPQGRRSGVSNEQGRQSGVSNEERPPLSNSARAQLARARAGYANQRRGPRDPPSRHY